MSRNYQPRRQSSRWLDGDCPADVLCLLDNRGQSFDRYTVIYRHIYTAKGYPDTMFGRGMSDHPSHPQGFGCSIEMQPYQVAQLRYAKKHQYCKWSDLPPDVQACIRRDCQPGGLGSNLPEPRQTA